MIAVRSFHRQRPMPMFAGTIRRNGHTTREELDEALTRASIRKFDQMTPRPQNLRKILQYSSSASNIKEMNSFLRDEYRIRCAERICMLEEKIPCFAEIPELNKVYIRHVTNFAEMSNHLPAEVDDFIPVVRSIVNRGKDYVSLMCKGMARLIHNHNHQQQGGKSEYNFDEMFVNKFMNEFLLNRIGSNVLMSQYLAVATGDDPPHPTSIVDPHCNVAAICRETAEKVRNLCLQETGFCPHIHVESHEFDHEHDFAFIPGVISYVIQELLKNSAQATAKKYKKETKEATKTTSLQEKENMTISVVICADKSRVMIHIGDRAGGIPFDHAQHIWSYLYSTKSTAGRLESRGATDLGGFGVGLPLSRLYASYLGGTINLVSLPGYGTHAYVFLPRLPENMVESVPIRATGWEANKSYNGEFIL